LPPDSASPAPDSERFGDQSGEACVGSNLGAVFDDEALALAGAPQPRPDRHDKGITMGPVDPAFHLQRRGDFRRPR
jgi:hypothetical protein